MPRRKSTQEEKNAVWEMLYQKMVPDQKLNAGNKIGKQFPGVLPMKSQFGKHQGRWQELAWQAPARPMISVFGTLLE
jgi:hypothetical protein